MSNKAKGRRSLKEILQSASDVLFPAELGKKQVEINSKDCEGDTPLHIMAWRKDRYAVDMLIKSGADVKAIGDMGETPLHVAILQEDERIIVSLLKAGARFDIPSEFNETAFERAVKKGGSIKKLLKQYDST